MKYIFDVIGAVLDLVLNIAGVVLVVGILPFVMILSILALLMSFSWELNFSSDSFKNTKRVLIDLYGVLFNALRRIIRYNILGLPEKDSKWEEQRKKDAQKMKSAWNDSIFNLEENE